MEALDLSVVYFFLYLYTLEFSPTLPNNSQLLLLLFYPILRFHLPCNSLYYVLPFKGSLFMCLFYFSLWNLPVQW